MTVSRIDNTVNVLFPSTTGEIESRCLHNCFTCRKLIFNNVNGIASIQCIERLNCSNGDKWEADENTKYVQEQQVKVPYALEVGHLEDEWLYDRRRNK